MVKITPETHRQKKLLIAGLYNERQPWWTYWRELADYILPRRYNWLMSDRETQKNRHLRNRYILDPTGTEAAKTLASGMMNGITSPSRPWFRLRVAGRPDESTGPARLWLDEVRRRMMLVMAESNFYNALAVMYLDLVVFGTASMLIYEDDDEVIRCYNNAIGEYYLGMGFNLKVDMFAREFNQTVKQLVERFGEENCSETVRAKWRQGGPRILDNIKVHHLIEPNMKDDGLVPARFRYREVYWEAAAPLGQVLQVKGFFELPGIFPRWELLGNDAYGVSPGMDALPDIIQLQHETKAKGQSLDYMNRPPVVADVQLEHRPTALLPRGVTYVAGINNVGVKPIYTVNPPLQDMAFDIQQVQGRIRETFHNDLFKMISQLETVRSATEIDARREEKLVLLGPVLERFENEALDPGIMRVFGIMQRAGLIPPMPPELEEEELEIQYVSILSDAQRAVGTVSTERLVGFVGNLAAVKPELLELPDWEELVRDYADSLATPAKNLKTREEYARALAAIKQQEAIASAAQVADPLTKATKQLSETEVGGGQNALQRMIGGGF